MKAQAGERLILFGPLGLVSAFMFCFRLRHAGVEYKLCRGPRSVAVRERDIHEAAALFDDLGGRQKR